MKRVTWASLAAAVFVSVACASTEDAPPASGASSGTPPPEVRILDDCPELPCEGPLEPGEYRWTFSDPTIDFTIPSSGWSWRYGGGGFELIADGTPPPCTRVCTSPMGSTSYTTRPSPHRTARSPRSPASATR